MVETVGFFERNHHIIMPALRYLGILLLFLLFYLLIFRPLKRQVFAYVERNAGQLAPGQVPQLAGAPAQLGEHQQLALPEGEQPKKQKEPSEEEKYGGEVTELAQRKPEVVTDLVKEWLDH